MDAEKLKEAFSDTEYIEGLFKMSAEEAAESLNERGCGVTAEDLTAFRDFVINHKDEIESGELSDETLALVSGGARGKEEYGGTTWSSAEITCAVLGSIGMGSLLAEAILGLCMTPGW
jgi:hypothetical protein